MFSARVLRRRGSRTPRLLPWQPRRCRRLPRAPRVSRLGGRGQREPPATPPPRARPRARLYPGPGGRASASVSLFLCARESAQANPAKALPRPNHGPSPQILPWTTQEPAELADGLALCATPTVAAIRPCDRSSHRVPRSPSTGGPVTRLVMSSATYHAGQRQRTTQTRRPRTSGPAVWPRPEKLEPSAPGGPRFGVDGR
jgi:hypothetical protein